MKKIIKLIIALSIWFFLFWYSITNAWIDWLNQIQWAEDITNNSVLNIKSSWNIAQDLKDNWLDILTLVKSILSWVLVIFIVYIWIQMVISMWSDEEQLSKAKRQLRYVLIWLVFINIPWTIFNSFVWIKWKSIDWSINWTWSNEMSNTEDNIFINTELFSDTLWWILTFIQVAIFSIAIFMIILSWIKLMMARWQDDQITEAKNKIIWSVVWLIFVWFIEAWQRFVYTWNISDWQEIFETIIELVLYFAWPTAIFFLSLAWYYYITSAWDEEKVTKAKNIVVNTVIATIILLASYAFLRDLMTLPI